MPICAYFLQVCYGPREARAFSFPPVESGALLPDDCHPRLSYRALYPLNGINAPASIAPTRTDAPLTSARTFTSSLTQVLHAWLGLPRP